MVGQGLQSKRTIIAFFLIPLALLAAGILLWIARGPVPLPADPSATTVSADPLGSGLPPQRGVINDWKRSDALFHARQAPAEAARLPRETAQALESRFLPEPPAESPEMVTVTNAESVEAVRVDTFSVSPVLQVLQPANPAVKRVVLMSPPALDSALAGWHITDPISTKKVSEQRRRIASGEKIARRADIRTPGPLDGARTRAQERQMTR